jgi:hypothetical protein
VVYDVATAIQELYARGVLHRDITPKVSGSTAYVGLTHITVLVAYQQGSGYGVGWDGVLPLFLCVLTVLRGI